MRDALLLRLLRTGPGAAGMLIVALGIMVALAAPLLFPGDPRDMVARPLTPAFANPLVPLGTDRLGRDILAGLAHGARATLATAGLVALVALLLGAGIGTVAGYAGGLVDEALMRLADATQTVPGFVLALALVSVLGPTQPAIVLALGPAPGRGPRGWCGPRP
jgi:peptide/nickel transport system permease protein